MADTWVTDMRHYLDEEGHLADLPGPALNLALFQGSIVSWVTSRASKNDVRTNVYCRRRPGRQRCQGEILASVDDASIAVVWECPFCGDNGYIAGWEGTEWDRRMPSG
jgi:hypothetical protein